MPDVLEEDDDDDEDDAPPRSVVDDRVSVTKVLSPFGSAGAWLVAQSRVISKG